MQPFGFKVFIHIPHQLHKKLDAKSQIGLFLGYFDAYKGYCFGDPKRKQVIICRDILFAENKYISTTSTAPDLSRTISTEVPFTSPKQSSSAQKNNVLQSTHSDSSDFSHPTSSSPSTTSGVDINLDPMPTHCTGRLSSLDNLHKYSVLHTEPLYWEK